MFFLYYNCGSCNDGDHDVNLEEFDTLKQAEARMRAIRERNSEGTVRILNGESVESIDW